MYDVRENEIVALALFVALAVHLVVARERLRGLPGAGLFMAATGTFAAALVCTVFEGVVLPEVFDVAEHVGYALAAALWLVWSVAARRAGADRGAR